ncbi:MAG: hypothetical protein U9R72_16310 [Chloroflexota bacterium]|nr:hypothetical protein [Chloroflexota bacterium]
MKAIPSWVLKRSIVLLVALLVAMPVTWLPAPASYLAQEEWLLQAV